MDIELTEYSRTTQRLILRDYGIKETASSKEELQQQVKETLIRVVP